MERLTDAEVQLVMETHVASEWCWENGSPHCADLLCEEEWPCPTYRLAAELATLRSQHAEVLATVREAVELMQGEASLWHDLYPAWLVYALLGEGATAAKPFSKVNRLNMSRQCDAIRALVALAEVQK